MLWTTLAHLLPIEPGDLVWGPTPQGLTRRITNGGKGEYLALDDARMCAAFDVRLARAHGIDCTSAALHAVPGGYVLVAGVESRYLPSTATDPLYARIVLWKQIEAQRAVVLPPVEEATATVTELVVEPVSVVTVPEAPPTPTAPPPRSPSRRTAR